ncbi:MAG: hypothetical protein QF449_01210 [Alphaproteobacteria bacterium]|jgi:hypothetical protein|nr:hypothetical protein [Alphaproteobacteria bacterium]
MHRDIHKAGRHAARMDQPGPEANAFSLARTRALTVSLIGALTPTRAAAGGMAPLMASI